MSFDLSQLDKLAKGELQEEPLSKTSGSIKKCPTPRPRVRPQVSRRKKPDAKKTLRWNPEGEDFSEAGLSKEWTLSRKSDQESTFAAPPDEISTPTPNRQNVFIATHSQWYHISIGVQGSVEAVDVVMDSATPGKKRKEPREKGIDDFAALKKRTARHDRLEKLAQMQDTSELTLCDLISRASYLEERTKASDSRIKNKPTLTSPAAALPVAIAPTTPAIVAPQVKEVDGRLVVNPESLEFTHRQPTTVEGYVRVEESDERIVNYHSYGDWSSRGNKWSREETELLVQGIGQFGIDFSLLERLFPGRDRKQIKSKFSRMWKHDPRTFGMHFNKSDGEREESYTKFVQDLKAERSETRTQPTSNE